MVNYRLFSNKIFHILNVDLEFPISMFKKTKRKYEDDWKIIGLTSLRIIDFAVLLSQDLKRLVVFRVNSTIKK